MAGIDVRIDRLRQLGAAALSVPVGFDLRDIAFDGHNRTELQAETQVQTDRVEASSKTAIGRPKWNSNRIKRSTTTNEHEDQESTGTQ